MHRVDVFVLLDIVQFNKNGYRNRVTIKTPQGTMWLTVPVVPHFGQLISEVHINNKTDWRRKHLRTIEMNYKRAPFFTEIMTMLESVYLGQNWEVLYQFNIQLIETVCGYLKLDTPLVVASSLAPQGTSTNLLIDIVKKLKGDVYYSGSGGADYLEENKFAQHGLTLHYTDFIHPVYKQLWKNFVQGTSIIDLLFNCGPQSMVYLDRANGTHDS